MVRKKEIKDFPSFDVIDTLFKAEHSKCVRRDVTEPTKLLNLYSPTSPSSQRINYAIAAVTSRSRHFLVAAQQAVHTINLPTTMRRNEKLFAALCCCCCWLAAAALLSAAVLHAALC